MSHRTDNGWQRTEARRGRMGGGGQVKEDGWPPSVLEPYCLSWSRAAEYRIMHIWYKMSNYGFKGQMAKLLILDIESVWSFDPELTTERLVARCVWIFCGSLVHYLIQAWPSRCQIIVFCFLSSVICPLSSMKITQPEPGDAPAPYPSCWWRSLPLVSWHRKAAYLFWQSWEVPSSMELPWPRWWCF